MDRPTLHPLVQSAAAIARRLASSLHSDAGADAQPLTSEHFVDYRRGFGVKDWLAIGAALGLLTVAGLMGMAPPD